MNILYSNLKNDTMQNAIGIMGDMNVSGIICDFTPTKELIDKLKIHGICDNYYRIKQLYRKPAIENWGQDIIFACQCGFKGIAIDIEPYSGSDCLQQDASMLYALGKTVGEIILCYFKEIILLPEDLGGKRYKNWKSFFAGLCSNKDLKVHLFIERTYQQREPWNLIFYYMKNRFLIRGKNATVTLGIWQVDEADDTLPRKYLCNPFWAWIQAKIVKLLGWNVFLYTEGDSYFFDHSEKMRLYRKLVS